MYFLYNLAATLQVCLIITVYHPFYSILSELYKSFTLPSRITKELTNIYYLQIFIIIFWIRIYYLILQKNYIHFHVQNWCYMMVSWYPCSVTIICYLEYYKC